MKRGIVKVLAAVFALSMFSATGASAASMDGVRLNYASQLQASGTAITHLSPGEVAVDVSYSDLRANSYSTYAKATFYKKTRICAHNQPCVWRWNQVGEKSAPTLTVRVVHTFLLLLQVPSRTMPPPTVSASAYGGMTPVLPVV